MPDEPSDDLKDEAEIAKALGLEVVVPEMYQDLLKPAAIETGKGLKTIAQTINIALLPLQGAIWGSEQIKDFITVKLTSRLKDVPPKNIVRPKPNVAGPAIEALKYCGHDDDLREIFANLLAASMNSETVSKAHPAFVEIIKQITPDEAKILKHLSNDYKYPLIDKVDVRLDWHNRACELNEEIIRAFSWQCDGVELGDPHNLYSYLDNLRRLQVIEITHHFSDDASDEIDSARDLDDLQNILSKEKERHDEIFFTNFGQQFIEICISPEKSLDTESN